MAKMSNYLIGILTVGFILTVVVTWLNWGYTQDNTLVYDGTTFTAMSQKLDETNALTEELKNKTLSLQQSQGLTDILGGFFSAGFSVLKTSLKSIDTGISLLSLTVDGTDLGDLGTSFYVYLVAVLIVVVILGIVISKLVKGDL